MVQILGNTVPQPHGKMKMQHPRDSAKCRCSIPTSVQSASNPERIIWPLRFPRRTFPRCAPAFLLPRKNGKEKERAWSSRRRAAARLERSHQRATPLFFPPRAAAFSGSRVDPRLRACYAPALFYRAPALITRHRGYYRGNAKRPSFWPLPLFPLPASFRKGSEP